MSWAGVLAVAFPALAGVGSLLLGLFAARGLSRRHQLVAAWLRALRRLGAGMGYGDAPLHTQLSRAVSYETSADQWVAGALSHAADRLLQDPMLPAGDAWDMGDGAFVPLTDADRAVLLPCLTGLGALDRVRQDRMLEGTLDALTLQYEQARERSAKDERLYATLGGLGGLALFLFLV